MGNNLKKILVVDDDETMRSLLSTLLTMEKYKVNSIAPNNLNQLLHEMTSFVPDIIILDIHLKHLNGLRVLEEIKYSPDFNNLKFIITSGEDLSTQAIVAGASYFLLKPYMPSELIECLHLLSS